ncbi:hypothetical protein IG631_07059 [Alternaria alternata]|nr:hypothetical protein IG631_07059 [Alternaria alternata]
MNDEPPLKTRVCEDWMIDSLSAGVLQKEADWGTAAFSRGQCGQACILSCPLRQPTYYKVFRLAPADEGPLCSLAGTSATRPLVVQGSSCGVSHGKLPRAGVAHLQILRLK